MIFHLISPSMGLGTRKWWTSLSLMTVARVPLFRISQKLNYKTETLTPKGVYIGFPIDLSELNWNWAWVT